MSWLIGAVGAVWVIAAYARLGVVERDASFAAHEKCSEIALGSGLMAAGCAMVGVPFFLSASGLWPFALVAWGFALVIAAAGLAEGFDGRRMMKLNPSLPKADKTLAWQGMVALVVIVAAAGIMIACVVPADKSSQVKPSQSPSTSLDSQSFLPGEIVMRVP